MSGLLDKKTFLRGGRRGKTSSSLNESRDLRSMFLQNYKQFPSTILKHDKRESDLYAIGSGRGYEDTGCTKRRGKKVGPEFEMSGKGRMPGPGTKSDALSGFSQNIGRMITDFYCPDKGIVYDPFAGHNSRMSLVFSGGRTYIGCDVSKEFMKFNKIICEKLLKRVGFFAPKDNTIILKEISSHDVDLPDNYADFTITSPPYWDIEYYGDEPEQLGKCETYQLFIERITLHIQENLRILKPGAYCCWFINDFVKDNVFYPYHSDLISVFSKVGFEVFAIYIVDLGSTIACCFLQPVFKRMRFAKRHEYCLVFRKQKGE